MLYGLMDERLQMERNNKKRKLQFEEKAKELADIFVEEDEELQREEGSAESLPVPTALWYVDYFKFFIA